MTIALYILLGVQALCWLLFLFGDIGFDKPGKYGLDFSALVLIGAVCLIALLSGTVLGFLKKRWFIASSQFLPILAALLYIYLPYRTYDPTNYQDLVGKSKAEVEKRIGHPRGAVTGFMSDDRHKDVEFIQLRGMVIYISNSGIVEGIEPSYR
jgi:hypothetical protein